MSFRELYCQDLWARLGDAVLHVCAAIVLPGPWYLQWGPDLMVVFLWTHGMCTDKLLPQTHWALAVHRGLHSLQLLGALWLISDWNYYVFALFLHFGAHWAIDCMTHKYWLQVTS